MVASCVGLDSFAGQTMHQVSKGIRLLLQTLRRACGVHVSGRWRIVVLALGLLATLVVAWLDYVTPQQVSFALAYLIPVVAVAWLARSTLYGMVLAYVCALGQGMVALAAGWHGESEIIVLWNAAVQFVLLAVVVGLLAVVHDLLAEHEQASLTDSLTGLANARALAACGRRELARSERYGGPLALAYFDLDGFKAVNDAAGHQEGDRLLAALGELLGGEVREPDTVARVGGDEFVVLMPQSDAAGGLATVQRLRAALAALGRQWGWALSCSVGLASFARALPSFEAMVACADELMYEAKAAGRDTVRCGPPATTLELAGDLYSNVAERPA